MNIDDIIMFSIDAKEYIHQFDEVLGTFEEAGATLIVKQFRFSRD